MPRGEETWPASKRPLEDFGLVGDGLSAALVTSGGEVAWWCPRRFDAPSVFASLLDSERGGSFATRLQGRHLRSFRYLPDSNVLESTFSATSGKLRVLTFMPYAEDGDESSPRRIVRILACEEGEATVEVEIDPRFNYGRAGARAVAHGSGAVLERVDGDEPVNGSRGREGSGGNSRSRASECLATSASFPFEASKGSARATLRMRAGETHAVVLEHVEGEAEAGLRRILDHPVAVAEESLAEQIAMWREWSSRCRYEGPHRDAVVRSLLALKLLQYRPTGAFVAAPTCSLPEWPGGVRNWDYRYSWLRDGVFIVMAFETAGYAEEADRFRAWLGGIMRRDAPERIQMLYRVDGGRDLDEEHLDHFAGYAASAPVRVGNEAATQHQLDTLGELMLCFHRTRHVFDGEHARENWRAVRAVVEDVAARWQEPDRGIWEMRGEDAQHVFSKAMAWIALDHGISIAEDHGFDAPLREWRRVRDAIHARLLEKGWSPSRRSFTAVEGKPWMDAALLLFPILGVFTPEDEHVKGTLDAVSEDLERHGLAYRYAEEDGLAGSEGAFLAASLWQCEALARAGEREKAVRIFERVLSLSGPLGLLSEEADPVTGTLLGNHPQALTHLSLVLAAWALEEVVPGSPVAEATRRFHAQEAESR